MAIRKMIALVIAVTFMVSITSPVLFASCGTCGKPASDAECAKVMAKDTCDKPKGDPLRKLGRGLANCLTFPIEIPNRISDVNNSDGPMAAVTYGLVKGTVMSLFRAMIGAYEVLTFPIPFPGGYRPIIKDPEFILEDWNA
ncbi:MAG: exosortase system-associated protein, TIGR04073 family [Candidatus Omnitrophica bacterium]|nr:exosortase system-associated protein, TIGR04073 family [Candidatus Omnitrophota bacterium]